MDSCTEITKWVKGGCDPNTICPIFVKNINHWTGQKIGGDLHNQKFELGEEQKLLNQVREMTGSLIVKDVVLVSNVESKSVNTQDGYMSDCEDLLADSETETDGINYGPTIQTEDSVFIFDVKQKSSVLKIYSDKSYRDLLTFENKDEVLLSLSKEVLEQRTLMDIGRKLNILRKKCEGRRIDMAFLWSLQEAFNQKLGGYIVKTEDSGSIDSLMTHFPVGSLNASNLEKIDELFGSLSTYNAR